MALLVVNSALTWVNQTSGSVGQKGRSLMLTVATVGPGARCAVPSTVGPRDLLSSHESSTHGVSNLRRCLGV